jgi:ligand-binding SRPBCC domain-containing protein
MSRTRHLEHASRLLASPDEVWAHVGCMSGVNAELGPWLRMTTPAGLADVRLEDAPLGVPLFSSGVLFLGVLPVDVHRFQLLEVTRGAGFVEQSTSWTERTWRHERSLEPVEGGQRCLLRDRLTFTPRLALMAPLLVRIVEATFRHRHLRLRERFGGEAA